jgi:hypothetical protein
MGTGPSPFHGPVCLRDTFLQPINLIDVVSPKAVKTLSPIRSSSMLISPSVVFMRAPESKQLVPPLFFLAALITCADELRPAKPNQRHPCTEFPTGNKAPSRRRHRGLSIDGSIQEVFLVYRRLISKSPNWKSVGKREEQATIITPATSFQL